MTKRDCVIAAMEGREPELLPAGFWLHFPAGCKMGDRAVEAHLNFARETGCDICKIMNESFLTQGFFIDNAADWNRVGKFDRKAPYVRDQVELVKRISDRVGKDTFVLATVHDICAAASHVLRNGNREKRDRAMQTMHLRENPKGMKAALEAITEINTYMAEEFLKAGADGVYFAVQNRKIYGYTHEEFENFIKPCDVALLEAVNRKSKYNVLHICKDELDLGEYADYPSAAVNWAMHGKNPSMEEGKKLFPGRVILGGLEHQSGVMIHGSREEIELAVKSLIRENGRKAFILGADCTLPSELPYERIRWAVEATHCASC